MRQERRNPSDRARTALAVVEREVALGRGVVLEDLRDAEALLEFPPDVRPQPVAAREAQGVSRLLLPRRVAEEITAQLADVLEQRAALGDQVLPETTRREALAQYYRAAADECGAGRDDTADAVIHRQAVVHAVRGLHVDQPREPVAPLHEAEVTDVGRLREPRGSGGVDAQRAICERGHTPFAVAERVTGQPGNRLIEPRQIAATCAAHPVFDAWRDQRPDRAHRLSERSSRYDVTRRDQVERVCE